jgi:hypothetical protein
VLPGSPLLFDLQALSMGVFGASEFTARLPVALVGGLLVLAPALFRGVLGPGRAFAFSLLLACSPVLLAASRTSHPMVLALAAAALLLWCVLRWWQRPGSAYAAGAGIAGACLLLLTDWGGIVLAIILAVSALITRWAVRRWTEPTLDDELDAAAIAVPAASAVRARPAFPWTTAAVAAVLTLVLVATGFMFFPGGLTAVGEVVAGLVRGFTPQALPLAGVSASSAALFYEPILLVFAGLAVFNIHYRRTDGTVDALAVFFTSWLALGAVASLLFAGSDSAHALWLTVPVAGIVARELVRLFAADTRLIEWEVPYWARSVIALVTIGLLLILTLSFQDMGRLVALNDLNAVVADPASFILFIVAILFLLVLGFLAASIWDARTALHGIGLGVIVLAAVTSLGSGWNAVVTYAARPFEPWHPVAVSPDTALLRTTLVELARRESAGFVGEFDLAVFAAQDSPVAWLLRDFTRARFVESFETLPGERVVLLNTNIIVELGASYVGQDFKISEMLPIGAIPASDLIQYWAQRRIGPQAASQIGVDNAYLWLRGDVYSGASELPGGS